MENVTSPYQVLALFVGFLVFCAVAGWWLFSIPKDAPVDDEGTGELIKRAWSELLHWQPVKPSEDSAPIVMSRSGGGAPPSMPSSLETRPPQTPDQTEDPAEKRAKLLDTYKPLRKLGMTRDDARAFLKPLGIPLDNNLWAEAAPVEEDAEIVTPYAGRRTKASYYPEQPELEYQAPA